MNYYKNNIKHVKGDTYSSALIVEGLGQALDSVYFTCRDSLKNDSTILFEKSLADGGITQVEYDEENDIRKYAVRIDPYDTRNLQAGTYFYDLQITVNTDVFTIMKGNFILEQDASRKGEPTEPEIIIQIKAQLDEINGEVINVTVFDKLDYLSETKGLIKDSLNNLGSEITDDNTFRNYASKIDDLYNEWPKVTDEGTTFTISNTKKGKMQLDVKGNTEQTTYTGKNLFDKDNTQILNYILNDAGYLATSDTNRSFIFETTPNTTYTLSKIAGDRFRVAEFQTMPTSGTLYQNRIKNDTATSIVYTTSSIGNYIVVNFASTIDLNNLQNILNSFQIEKNSTATDYEPYVGGTASPNPNYPQDIRVVKGDNTIKIIGKNLLDGEIETGGWNFTYGQSLSKAPNNNQLRSSNKILVEPNKEYIFSLNGNAVTQTVRYIFADKDNIVISSVVNNTGEITIPNNCKYLVFHSTELKTVYGLELTNPMIEQNNMATTYEPYQQQSYVFYLEDLELCKIGDYQDYIYKSNNTWYKYKAIDKVVLDGSESWSIGNDILYIEFNGYKRIEGITCICNYYQAIENVNNSSGIKPYNNTIAFRKNPNDTINQMFINDTQYNNVNEFKNWLSTHNTTVYYVLETPTSIEITDLDLIEQLNSLENAISYNNETNIFTEYEEGNISLIISASALMKGSE